MRLSSSHIRVIGLVGPAPSHVGHVHALAQRMIAGLLGERLRQHQNTHGAQQVGHGCVFHTNVAEPMTGTEVAPGVGGTGGQRRSAPLLRVWPLRLAQSAFTPQAAVRLAVASDAESQAQRHGRDPGTAGHRESTGRGRQGREWRETRVVGAPYMVASLVHPLAPPATDRKACLREGQECHRNLLRGLLDLTDNQLHDLAMLSVTLRELRRLA